MRLCGCSNLKRQYECCSDRMQLRECDHGNHSKPPRWSSKLHECGGVHTAGGCENVLHESRGSGRCLNIEALGTSVQKFIGPIHDRSNLLDAILCVDEACDVNAENISKCNKSIIYFR